MHDEAELASRFLYTLHQAGGLQPGSELRAKVVYQIFELLLDAGDKRTALTDGDLSFYQDVAKSDPHPGMLGGVLSLLLADSNPQYNFDRAEQTAVAHFNRAAAYRVFNTFKREYPTSPALAQMYLDLIRIHTSAKETELAAALLDEFDKRYSDAPQFAEVALKLSDAFILREDRKREQEIYQALLDRLGKQRKKDQPLVPTVGGEELTRERPATADYPPNTNYGYDFSSVAGVDGDDLPYSPTRFRTVALNDRKSPPVDEITYAMVLARYVASLMKENRAADVLALYSAEVKKYPDEQGLYEQRLQWLGQTNLAEDQLRVYQEAIQRFKSNVWTDRLARWYLRQNRRVEFEKFSRELLSGMNDRDVESYLNKFIQSGADEKAAEFDANLYLGLHRLAHERFPHNRSFVEGLLNYYAGHKQWDEWQRLLAEHYFESKEIRQRYLSNLSRNGKLREYAQAASGRDTAIYKMFRADASAWLSNFEEAIESYRELNQLYPNTPEFVERLVSFTRSFGQKDQTSLEECARLQLASADAMPSSTEERTRAGEVFAELGDYKRAAAEWEKLLKLGAGDEETFLETATVYWDYFQYGDALRVLKAIRAQKRNDSLYAFQIAAIYESQHKTSEALAEYVKELHVHSPNYWRAKARLRTLYARKDMPQQVRQALLIQLGKMRDADQRDGIVLGYAFLMNDLERWGEAALLLKRQVAGSNWPNFLNNAQELFSEHEDAAGELATLRRLAVVARTERQKISYRLQLAERAAKAGQKELAAAMLSQLIASHPTNYGVLTEAADFYWRINKREQAMRVLTGAAQRSKGRFRYIFARKLAARQIERGQLVAAETTLKKLYDENPANLDVFRELSKVYVRLSKVDALRQRYRETIRAVKDTETDHLALRQTIAALRQQVIESFTQLRDYSSAIEQHIEIINRNPDDETSVNAAIEYAKRYGGADTMIAYYAKTSEQAFKDYRWNLVLSRLYSSKGDWTNAKTQLKQAINNQPEMIELYSELAEGAMRVKDYAAAIDALKLCVERTNDDPAYLRRLAEVFDKAGRTREAVAARAKLPVEKAAPTPKNIGDQFAAAAALPRDQRAKAIAAYRQAFDAFQKDFYKHELNAYELQAYVSALRDEEPLDQIARRLWEVRERIRRDTVSGDNLLAGKARSLLETFDRALPETVGKIATEFATGDELSGLHRDLMQLIGASNAEAEADGSQAVLLNLSYRAGFNDLAERILIARKDSAARLDPATTTNPQSIYQGRFMTLVNFYSERGAYLRIVELAEQELAKNQRLSPNYYRSIIAEYSRLIGDSQKELATLRAEFQSHSGNPKASNDSMVERYFEALLENGEAGRGELQQIVGANTPHRFQLINFLLRYNEKQLAVEAINASHQSGQTSAVWKASRQAELILAARDLNQSNEAFFTAALGLKNIGEMIAAKPDSSRELIGDNWFALAESYGRWLSLSETSLKRSGKFLPAMLENNPKDAAEQHRLARWYLERKAPQQALEHLQIAAEMRDSNFVQSDIGSAYFEMNDKQKAREQWAKLIAREKPSVEDCQLYLATLSKHGLQVEARTMLQPLVIKRLSGIKRDGNSSKEFEALQPLIRSLVDLFEVRSTGFSRNPVAPVPPEGGTTNSAFLRQIAEAVPADSALPEMVIRERLVAGNQIAPFYEMLVKRSRGFSSWESDSNFVDRVRTHPTWQVDEIEESLDHSASQNNLDQPQRQTSERLVWQKEFLDYLIAEKKNNEAVALIQNIEQDLKGRFARPSWLRLAKLRLDVRAGQQQAITGLKHFALIEVGERIDKIAQPNLERLNQGAAMLRGEGRQVEAGELLRAAYERQLALEQFSEASFVGLARLEFAKGDTSSGLKLLKLMNNLAAFTTRNTAAAELAASPAVKARVVSATWVERPAASNQLSVQNSLRLAAETAAEFGQFVAAIDYRQRLLEMSPGDNDCRLELGRVLAADKRENEAAKLLASLIADRQVGRQMRWAAAWIAPEIANKRQEVWQSFASQVQAGKDTEMIVAVEALAAFDRGQAAEAAALVGKTNIPSVQLQMLRGVLLKRNGQEREALNEFLASQTVASEASAMVAFGFGEDEFRWQLIRLLALLDQPRAALKLAGADERLRGAPAPAAEVEELKAASARLLTLQVRATERQRQSRLELLALLSLSAERIGEFDKAADFESARVASLRGEERRKSEARIEQLKARQKEKVNKRGVPLSVNEALVAAR
jgi:predicted Zn-dependent protease